MGRFRNIEIQGLLISDFGKLFIKSINTAIKTSNLTEEEALEKIAPELENLLTNYEESISSFYVQNHKFELESFLKLRFKNQQKIAITHRESFVSFILYINVCFNIYEKIVEKLKRKKVDSTLKMTVVLYGIIIRRGDEILTQLLNGYIDGAMIMWRSLYENAVILLVLALENDNELADKYVQHSIKNSRRKIMSYQKNFEELKFKPLSKKTEKILKSNIDEMNARFGKGFLENEYGWADNLFKGNQKANFMLLEEYAKMSRFRPYYLMCCEQIHSNFNGFMRFMEGDKIILPKLVRQEINFKSYIDPMQFTISVLHEVNNFILYEFSVEEEYNANVLLMRKVFEKQQKTFYGPKGEMTNRCT